MVPEVVRGVDSFPSLKVNVDHPLPLYLSIQHHLQKVALFNQISKCHCHSVTLSPFRLVEYHMLFKKGYLSRFCPQFEESLDEVALLVNPSQKHCHEDISVVDCLNLIT